MPASDGVQATSSSRSKIDSKIPLKRSTKLRLTSTMRIRSDAARASPYDMPVIYL